MIALLLALWYLPATAHCLLEQVGWLAPGADCCDQKASDDGSQSLPCPYGCCPSEYAVYFNPIKGDVSLLAVEVPPCVVMLPLAVLPEQSEFVPPESSPPELPKVWQFSFRTALSPRAPSFVS